MNMKTALLFVLGYLVMALVSACATYAYFQLSYPRIAKTQRREDSAFAIFCGLIPVMWIVSLFFTGFYEFGFCLPFTTPKTLRNI